MLSSTFDVGVAAHWWRFADVWQTGGVPKEIGGEATAARSTSDSGAGRAIAAARRCTASISIA